MDPVTTGSAVVLSGEAGIRTDEGPGVGVFRVV